MFAEGIEAVNWAQSVSSLGFAGLAWYLITVAVPRMLSAFRDELAAERAARAAERGAFFAELNTIREAVSSQRQEFLQGVRELGQSIAHSRGPEPR